MSLLSLSLSLFQPQGLFERNMLGLKLHVYFLVVCMRTIAITFTCLRIIILLPSHFIKSEKVSL